MEINKILIEAARQGDVKQILACIEQGANKEAIDKKTGNTPLLLAVRFQHTAAVQILLDQQTNIQAQDRKGNTAFMGAVLWGQDPAILTLLQMHGAVFDSPWHQAAYTGDLTQLQSLLKMSSGEVNFTPPADSNGNPFIFYVAASGKLEILAWCLDKGLGFNTVKSKSIKSKTAKNSKGAKKNCLDEASDNSVTGYEVTPVKNKQDETLLHYCIKKGELALVDWLLDKHVIDLGHAEVFQDSIGESLLWLTVRYGNLPILQALLHKDFNLQEKTIQETILQAAVEYGHTRILQWLHTQSVSVAGVKVNDITLLQLAAQEGHLAVMQWLFQQGLDLHETEITSDDTLLHEAAYRGHIPIMEWLLAQGLSIAAQNNQQKTVLQIAMQIGNLALVKFLFQQGASLENNVVTDEAYYWCLKHAEQVEIFDLLIEKGFDIKHYLQIAKQNLLFDMYNSQTILWLAKQGFSLEEKEKNHGRTILLDSITDCKDLSFIQSLVQLGAQLNVQDSNGNTALLLAMEARNDELAAWLAQQPGININAVNDQKMTALSIAIRLGKVELTKQLVRCGASLEQKFNFCKTPLLEACGDKKLIPLAYWLIEQGVSLKAVDDCGDTALHLAIYASTSLEDIAFLDYLVTREPSLLATKNNEGETVLIATAKFRENKDYLYDWLMTIGHGLVNVTDNEGKSALYYAVESLDEVLVEKLLQLGANPAIKVQQEETLLLLVIEKGQHYKKKPEGYQKITHIAQLLINYGVSLQGNRYATPLLKAITTGNTKLALWLINNGSNVNEKIGTSKYFKTPLFCAIEYKQREIVQLLIEKGAQLKSKDADGNSPLYLAVLNDEFDIAMLLLAKGAVTQNIKQGERVAMIEVALRKMNNVAMAHLLLTHGGGIGLEVMYTGNFLLDSSNINSSIMDHQIVIGMHLNGKPVTRATAGFEKAITTLGEYIAYKNQVVNLKSHIQACTQYLLDRTKNQEIKCFKQQLILSQSDSLTQTCLTFIRAHAQLKKLVITTQCLPQPLIDEIVSVYDSSSLPKAQTSMEKKQIQPNVNTFFSPQPILKPEAVKSIMTKNAVATLTILGAAYGLADVTEKVRALVSNNTLVIKATNKVFGDTWKKVNKTLVIVYQINDFSPCLKVVTEGRELHFDTSHSTLNDHLPHPILGAVYGRCDITAQVRNLVNNHELTVAATSDKWGDSWEGVRKSLVIVYLSEGVPKVSITEEGKLVGLVLEQASTERVFTKTC